MPEIKFDLNRPFERQETLLHYLLAKRAPKASENTHHECAGAPKTIDDQQETFGKYTQPD